MKPLVTFVLLSYNQEDTAADAARCALDQDYPNLEIVVSDDGSRDRTFERLREVCEGYSGPHRVKLLRNETNQGLVPNLQAALDATSGGLAVLAAADDRSMPTRVSELAAAWIDAGMPRVALIYSDVRPIDREGRPIINWTESVVRPPFGLAGLANGGTGPLGAACAMTPCLGREPQPVESGVLHEDRVFPFRAALLGGPILFVDKPLVEYRVEGGVSRNLSYDRWGYMTAFMADFMRRVIPDAKQRLSDALLTSAPEPVVRRCRQLLTEQDAFLAMADGRHLVRKAAWAVRAGARPAVMAAHLLRFARASLLKS